MSSMLKSLGIDQLSVAQRILLVEEIWESVAAEEESISLTDAQKKDLDRRIAKYEAHPNEGSPWTEVMARLQGEE